MERENDGGCEEFGEEVGWREKMAAEEHELSEHERERESLPGKKQRSKEGVF